MVVRGTDEVIVCTIPWNGGKNKRERYALMLTKLRDGEAVNKVVFTRETAWVHDYYEIFKRVYFNYDKNNNSVVLLTCLLESDKTIGSGLYVTKKLYTYSEMLSAYDAETLKEKFSKNLDYNRITKARRELSKIDEDYVGLPEALIVHDDGTTTVVSSEYNSELHFHDLAVLDYDSRGGIINSYLVHKRWVGVGFNSSKYLSVSTAGYVLFNDNPENFEPGSENDPKKIGMVSLVQTACYRMQNGEMKKSYFFGEPDHDFDGRFSDFSCESFNKETSTYCVMLTERNGRRKEARLAWVHLK